jgi:hypothetical protein
MCSRSLPATDDPSSNRTSRLPFQAPPKVPACIVVCARSSLILTLSGPGSADILRRVNGRPWSTSAQPRREHTFTHTKQFQKFRTLLVTYGGTTSAGVRRTRSGTSVCSEVQRSSVNVAGGVRKHDASVVIWFEMHSPFQCKLWAPLCTKVSAVAASALPELRSALPDEPPGVPILRNKCTKSSRSPRT